MWAWACRCWPSPPWRGRRGWLALPLSLLMGLTLLLLAGALVLFRPSGPAHPMLERVTTPLLALSVATLGVLFLAVSLAPLF